MPWESSWNALVRDETASFLETVETERMTDTKTAEIQEKLSDSLKQLDADVENIVFAAHRVTQLLNRATDARKQLLAEARGILESSGVVDPVGDGASLAMSEYNRLREILDELEKLP